MLRKRNTSLTLIVSSAIVLMTSACSHTTPLVVSPCQCPKPPAHLLTQPLPLVPLPLVPILPRITPDVSPTRPSYEPLFNGTKAL